MEKSLPFLLLTSTMNKSQQCFTLHNGYSQTAGYLVLEKHGKGILRSQIGWEAELKSVKIIRFV